MRRRPLIAPALAFALGAFAAAQLLPNPTAALALAAGLILAGAGMVKLARRPYAAFALILGAVAATGAAYYAAAVPSARATVAAWSAPSAQALVRGVVADEPTIRRSPAEWRGEEASGFSTFSLELTHIRSGDAWQPVSGAVRVLVAGAADDLRYGEVVELACMLGPFERARNPGQFDPRMHWIRRGYAVEAQAPLPENVRPVGRKIGATPLAAIFAAKRAMRRYLNERQPEDAAATLRCLLLGDRRALSDEQERNFRDTGTVHFMAVSGLHVGLLAMSVWFLLALIGLRPRATAMAVLMVVILYAVLGGLRPSILRAALMCAAVCLGYLFDRRPDFLNVLALAAIVILVIDPSDVLDPGFHLSFAAVIGIAVLAERLRRALFGERSLEERLTAPGQRRVVRLYVRHYVEAVVCISLAAWIATVALTAHLFHAVVPFTPLVNLLLTPLVWGVLLAGFPAVILGPLIGGFAEPFVLTAGYCATALNQATALLAQAPAMRFFVAGPHPAWIVVYYAVLAFLVLRPRLGVRRRHAFVAVLVVGNLFTWSLWRDHATAGQPSLSVLNVGSGCAAVLSLGDGAHVLYDAGSASRMKVGERVIAPYLWSQGIRRLDAVVISHADTDHVNGLTEVLDRFPVGVVIMPEAILADRRGPGLVAELRKHGIPLRLAATGDVLSLGGATMKALHPPATPSLYDRLSANESSLTLRVEGAGASVLLTGDAEAAAIAAMLRAPDELPADVLLAPHHGKSAARLGAFLDAVAPSIIAVSGVQPPTDPAYAGRRVVCTCGGGIVVVDLDADAPAATCGVH